jgi:sugar lactone lactonase YvrE
MDEAKSGPEPIGQVWSYDGRSAPRILFGGVKISNSIAFSPDGRLMYFADTPNRRIDVFDYDTDTGIPSNRRVFVTSEATAGYPDGSTVDSDGCLWNAEWGGSRVTRYTPQGKIDRVIELPVPFVTCCAFGGSDLKSLYMTTARVGMEQKDLQSAPLSGSLFTAELGVPGLIDTQFNTDLT